MSADVDLRTWVAPSDDVAELVDRLRRQLDEARAARARADEQVLRLEAAIDALTDEALPRRRRRQDAPTSHAAILAALASFPGPIVSSQTLLDHPDLVHYSRNVLRKALAEMRAGGTIIAAERTPKGFLWQVPSK